MRTVRRCIAVGALGAGVVLASAMPAGAAANPKASCVGTVVSTLAPVGAFDVNEFKALAEALGTPNFGQFVAEGARLHLGTIEECVPAHTAP
jgi:hypothetical protein